MSVFSGRYSAKIEGDFVVFLIGMRVNRPLRIRSWWPVFTAMPKMVKELEQDPSTGFLGAWQGLWSTGPSLVQYWRSFEELERYARDPRGSHLPCVAALQPARPRQRRRRHLARDLPRAGGRVRDDLRQHAARRPRRGRRAPAVGLDEHRGAPDRRAPAGRGAPSGLLARRAPQRRL